MKLAATFLVIFSFAYYVDAYHLEYKQPEPGWAGWSLIEDSVCKRPTSGDCSQAGSCCGEKVGTQRVRRECVEGHCKDAVLLYTRDCGIRCNEADKDAYGPWEREGECELPATGECSERKPVGHECCGKLIGKMKFTRECKADNGCAAGTLERYRNCNIRCEPDSKPLLADDPLPFVSCNRPDVPYKGSAVCKGPDGAVLGDNESHPLGSVCTYSCTDGLVVTPAASTVLECTSNVESGADWDKNTPCCKLAECGVQNFMDLIIIVDKSRSNREKGWESNIKFMSTFLSRTLNIGPDNVRVGIIPFAKHVDTELQIDLRDTTNQDDLLNAVQAMSGVELESYTYTASAMRYAADVMLKPSLGERELAPNLVVVLTDGKPTEGLDKNASDEENDKVVLGILEDAAAHLRTKATVFAVGIGVGQKEDPTARKAMGIIAGDTFPDNQFIVKNHSQLETAASLIENKAISGACDACVADPNN